MLSTPRIASTSRRLLTTLLGITLSAFLLAACGGSKQAATSSASQESVSAAPDWYLNPPEDPDFTFGAATSTSRSMQLAIDKAATGARAEIASGLEAKFSSLERQFQEEIGSGEDTELLSQFTQARKTVVSQVLNGVTTRDREVITEQSLYRAFVLMEMPIGEAATKLMDQLKANDALYTRFRATQAHEDLEEEVERYEQDRREARERQRGGGEK